MQKLNLKNVYSYADFLNEGKNEYAVYIDGKMYSEPGDYKTGNATFKEATSVAKPGSKVEMYKTKDNKGKDVKELKKEKEVKAGSKATKKKPISKDKEIKSAIKETVLELFISPRKFTHEELKVDKPFDVSFYISHKDFKNTPYVDFSKDYSSGIAIKKPYEVEVLSMRDENGTDLSEENIDRILEEGPKTTGEEKTLKTFKIINDMDPRGTEIEKPGEHKITLTVLIKENPLYGKSKEEIETKDDDIDDLRDDWYKSDEDDEDVDLTSLEDSPFDLDDDM